MRTHLFEVTNGRKNWGKFLVGVMDAEWHWRSAVSDERGPLLRRLGWGREHIWVLDLATGEGAYFRHGGHAKADLDRHKIHVCVLFEAFLGWLYAQDLDRLDELSGEVVDLPDVPFAWQGYRRPGPQPNIG